MPGDVANGVPLRSQIGHPPQPWTTLWTTSTAPAPARQRWMRRRVRLLKNTSIKNLFQINDLRRRRCGLRARTSVRSAEDWRGCGVVGRASLALPMAELVQRSPRGRGVWSVAALVAAVAALLEHGFPACTVRGEISGFSRAASGHCYFNAEGPGRRRDACAARCSGAPRQLLDFPPRDGQRVELRGRLAVYEPRGELQFVAEAMQTARRRRALRAFPSPAREARGRGPVRSGAEAAAAGFIRARSASSPRSPARRLHDVATTLARRSPHVRVVVYPSAVQGADAPAALCAAIALAAARREVDVLVVCRGGGSLEDLWAFNDEARRARDPRGADAGRERRRPRDRRHPRRSGRRPARGDADRSRRARRAGDGGRSAARSHGLEHAAGAARRRRCSTREAQRLDRLALRLARPARRRAARPRARSAGAAAATAPPARARAAGARRAPRLRRAAAPRARASRACAASPRRLEAAAVRLQALDPQPRAGARLRVARRRRRPAGHQRRRADDRRRRSRAATGRRRGRPSRRRRRRADSPARGSTSEPTARSTQAAYNRRTDISPREDRHGTHVAPAAVRRWTRSRRTSARRRSSTTTASTTRPTSTT